MNAALPRYLLLVESSEPGRWRFVLCHQETGRTWSAGDCEVGLDRQRLSLLALVRGLEALPEPAGVTLVTPSRRLRTGVERGLSQWRARDWKWERFGRLVTIRDHDLWRRVDQALEIHRLICRSWRLSITNLDETAEDPGRRSVRAPRRQSWRDDTPDAFAHEPALLVVRKPSSALRFRPTDYTPSSGRIPAASAG